MATNDVAAQTVYGHGHGGDGWYVDWWSVPSFLFDTVVAEDDGDGDGDMETGEQQRPLQLALHIDGVG